jgi:phosphatidylglycerophosphatase A
VAPGTVGSFAAVLIAFGLYYFAGFGPLQFGVMAAALLIPSIWAAHRVALDVKRKDPGLVVIDEVVGQWITLAGVTSLGWKSWVAAFLLFRVLDVVKPPPARQLERLPGGVGIVLDDVMAGLYGALVLFAAGCFNLY